MMRLSVVVVLLCCCGAAYAKPAMDKSAEAAKYLPSQSEMADARIVQARPSQWFISNGENGSKYAYVGSATQRWHRSKDLAEVVVEAAIFPDADQALAAAKLRVDELKMARGLQEQPIRGDQLPNQAQGGRSWGLLDLPKTSAKPDACRNAGPVSLYAAVVFVKKDVAVQVSMQSRGTTNVSLSDLEALAKKIAPKIKPEEPKNNDRSGEPGNTGTAK